jgi:hypothetical protein
MARTYKTEFKEADWPDAAMVAWLESKGLIDESWGNDVCPSWSLYEGGARVFQVFVQPADPARREPEDCRRFFVLEDMVEEPLIETDDEAALRSWVEANLNA